jgi:hypothetical protein
MSQIKVHEKLNWLENDIQAVRGKLDNLNKKTLEFSEAVKTWEEMTESEKKLQGLRINESKDLLDLYKEKFRLTKVNTEFSKPVALGDRMKTDFIKTISSNVSITFSTLTDELAFNFIYSLINEFPGHVNIRSYSLTRSGGIDKVILEDIARGNVPGLVTGKIDFIWRDLKYTPPKSEENSS